MKWGAIMGVCLLIIALTLAEQKEEKDDDQQPQSSIARAQWQDVQHPNHESSKGLEEKEEETEDQFEQSRRIRVRNGPKRRRRLRKRPRTTTPSTGDEVGPPEEATEDQYPARGRWSQEDSVDYLPVDQDYRPYRRRPGKRRRRPLRKQYADQQPETLDTPEDEELYRRRRKGYRKRIRLQEEFSDGSTQHEERDHKRNQTIKKQAEEVKPTKSETSQNKPLVREESVRHPIKSPSPEDIVLNLAATRRQHFEQQTTTIRSKSEETQIHDDFRQLIKHNRPQDRHRDKSQKQHSTEKKETETEHPKRSKTDRSKEKVFDRKSLFATSRRLPQTSAVIRRRLRPKNGTLEALTELKTKNLVPKGYDKQMPEIIPPYKLIEEMMSTINTTTTEKDSSEEPNYPKTQSPRTRVRETTPKLDTSSYIDDQNMYTTIEDFFKVGKEPQTTTTTTTTTTMMTTTITTENKELQQQKNDDSLENFNIANVEDHILDLLLTKNSSSRLAKILELRNMTLIQLIQHRERGSSQLHFSEPFNKQNETSTEKGVPYLNDNVKNDVSEDSDTNIDSSNMATKIKLDLREPRIFDSLPDFNKNSLSETKTQTFPTWSVIPNPDLTPVSINNNDGVPVITRATLKPVYSDNIEEIILIEDNTVERYPGSFNMNIANRISDGIKTFKKFPPGVKSAIIVSLGILVLAIIGFLSVLISCRVRQKRSRLRAKRDVLNEQLHNEEFMNSQRSLSPVLSKNQPSQPSFTQGIHSNTSSNRHYYLWRTLRKTFQYD